MIDIDANVVQIDSGMNVRKVTYDDLYLEASRKSRLTDEDINNPEGFYAGDVRLYNGKLMVFLKEWTEFKIEKNDKEI